MHTKKTQFISVEVSIKTSKDISAFVDYFESKDNCVNVIDDEIYGKYVYCDPILGPNANTVIAELCQMIHSLPNDVRKVWDEAAWKQFYAGFHVGEEPNWFPENFELSVLKSCCELGAGIGIALYPAQLSDAHGIPVE